MPRQSMRWRSINSSQHAPSHAAARRSDIDLGPRGAIEIGNRPGRSATVRIAICSATGSLTHETISQRRLLASLRTLLRRRGVLVDILFLCVVNAH